MTLGRLDYVRWGGREVPIGPAGVLIGRDPKCDLVIDRGSVSREHARVENRDNACWLTDLGSRNGTSVNGMLVKGGRAQLTNGDRIRVGDEELIVLAGERTHVGVGPATGPLTGPLEIADRPLTIGRDPGNVLVLADPNVSRFHAIVERHARGIMFRDLSSRNGSAINARPVSRAILSAGDVLAIGASRFTFTGTHLVPIDQKAGLRLECHGVSVRSKGKQLLEPTDLAVEPGEMVAIIGESGAGKSTLLKCLAAVTRPSSGEVLVNGEPVTRRLTEIGYVPQDDIVHRLLTLREALRYAAKLRLPPDTSSQEVDAAVARVIGDLELGGHEGTRVDRLSGGQRKRAGVAIELLSQPGVLFLDEPATGLDPGLEKKLMAHLRDLSDGGRPVVTVTHSTASLPLCDRLIVMGRGGVACYMGSPAGALAFFEVDDYADIYTALGDKGVEHWRTKRGASSSPAPALATATSVTAGPQPRLAAAPGAAERQPAVLPQATVLASRNLRLKLRDTRNLAILLGQAPVLAVAIAIGFRTDVFANALTRLQAPTLMFMAAITAIWLGAFAGSREIVKEKAVFLRERAVGVSVRAYLLSKLAVLLLLSLAQSGLLLAVLLAMRPLYEPVGTYIEVSVIYLMTSVAAVGIGLLISSLARSEEQPASIISLFLIPQLVFGGAVIPLAGKGIAFNLVAAIMLARWAFAGLGSSIHLDRVSAVTMHYGAIFNPPAVVFLLVVALFAAAALLVVAWRLVTQET